MSFAIQIDVRDAVSPVLRGLANGLTPSQLNPVVGRAARNVYVNHLRTVNSERPNRLGGRRTNFYLGAARGTQFRVVEDGVIISISQVGIAQRYFGGTIKPKSSKFLTLPVHPAAHGKRASEFDLEVVFGKGGRPVALATKKQSDVKVRATKGGKITRTNATKFGEIYFLLVKSVTQRADPTVLPTPADVFAGITPAVTSHVDRLIQRQGGTP